MKKRALLLYLFTLLGIGAWADEYPYLVFENTDGSTKVVSVESLKITFSDGNLVAVSNNGGANIPLATLAKMYFSASSTLDGLNGTELRTAGQGAVYNLQGIRVGTLQNGSNSLKGLPQGVYVIERNGKTEKVVVK